MSYTSQTNLSTSQPNLSSSHNHMSSSLEKKTWFINKFLCKNLDADTYSKISNQLGELKALKTKVKLNSRGWKVGGRMSWNSPVCPEFIPLNAIHDITQDATYISALLLVLKFDRVEGEAMYEILAYKFNNTTTPLAFQQLFRKLTGTKDSLLRFVSRNSLNNSLGPGIHYSGIHRDVTNTYQDYKYYGQNKKSSFSDLDSLDNATSLNRQGAINEKEDQWCEGEAKVYVKGNDGRATSITSHGTYYSSHQNKFLQVPRIGSRSDVDAISVTSQNSVYLLNPKFKRSYVSRSDVGVGNGVVGDSVGGDGVGGDGVGGVGGNVADIYPTQETRFL